MNGYLSVVKIGKSISLKGSYIFNPSKPISPIVLLCHLTIHSKVLDEYKKFAKDVDDVVNETEPGMLYHSMDQDPSAVNKFTWTEVYANSEAIIAHFDNGEVKKAMSPELNEKFYDGGMDIHIYGTVTDEIKKEIEKRNIKIIYHDRVLGFCRI